MFMARKIKKVCFASPEDLRQVNPKNLALLEEFMEYYVASDHSESSCVVVRSNLNIFFVWLKNHRNNKDFKDVKKKDILAYQGWLLSNDLSPARVRNLKSAISSLSIYIEDMLDEEEEWSNFRNLANKIKPPTNVPVRIKTILKDEQIEEYLQLLVERDNFRDAQRALALALAWASGSRISELLRFKVSFFDDKNKCFDGQLYKTPVPIKTKGKGRKGKPLEKYTLVHKFQPYLEHYLNHRKLMHIPNELDDLFVVMDREGKWRPMPLTTLESYAETFSKEMNCDFYFHCMRHSCCTEMLRAGLPDSLVVELFGWSSSDLLKVYDDRTKEEKFSQYTLNFQ